MCQLLGECFTISSLSSFLEGVESGPDSVSDINKASCHPCLAKLPAGVRVHFSQGFSQPPAQVSDCHLTWGPHELWGASGEAFVLSGRTAPVPPSNTLRPDSLLKMTLGGVTLTLLQTYAPSSGPPDLTTHFFAEFDATVDGSFGSQDLHRLRPRFQRACPCSHVRYKPKAGLSTRGLPEPLKCHLLTPSFFPVG